MGYRATIDLKPGPWLYVIGISGAIAILLVSDAARHYCTSDRLSEVLLCLAEAFWVIGNVVWALEDVITGDDEDLSRNSTMVCFAIGALLTVCEIQEPSKVTAKVEDIEASTEKAVAPPDVVGVET